MSLSNNRAFRAIPLAVLGALLSPAAALESPSGKYDFQLTLKDGQVSYSVTYDGKSIVAPSALGFELKSGKVLGDEVDVLTASAPREVETSWKPVYGERAVVDDHYRTQNFTLQGGGSVAMMIEVRSYDEGVAFCYQLQGKDRNKEVLLIRENTEYSFPADHETWTATSAQGYYSKRSVSKMGSEYERPQLFHAKEDGLYLAIGEARLVDFSRMRLTGSKGKKNTVVAALSGPVRFTGKMTSPWRFVMAAKQPGKLLEHNDFLLNLNDPCEIQDTSWIRPGKVLRDVRLTNEGARRAIDFAAENGIDFVHFDAGWYGHEYDKASDATTASLDPKRTKGPFDPQKLVKYAKERGVGITVYVNQRALTKQLDVILPLYQKWGIAGVKYGFVNVGSQEATTWLHEAVRKAADHKLMVDIHDEYRPTGYSRTYPNLMTQEGIGGDETSPTAEQTLGIFFPRYLAGAADHTVCYFTERVVGKVNHAFQLGKTVCCYSPWQFIYWYDAPSAGSAGGPPIMGRKEPELEFFKFVPTVWDESRVLEGRIGESVVMARRSGMEWYLGAMNGSKASSKRIKLDFLETGKSYLLRSYTHDESIPTQTKVRVSEKLVSAGDVLTLDLKMNDGAAFRIMPKDE
jgi:alpha-glucosidase